MGDVQLIYIYIYIYIYKLLLDIQKCSNKRFVFLIDGPLLMKGVHYSHH